MSRRLGSARSPRETLDVVVDDLCRRPSASAAFGFTSDRRERSRKPSTPCSSWRRSKLLLGHRSLSFEGPDAYTMFARFWNVPGVGLEPTRPFRGKRF